MELYKLLCIPDVAIKLFVLKTLMKKNYLRYQKDNYKEVK